MADLERLTVTLPSDMVAAVKSAVNAGDYASASELVREAISEWKTKRFAQVQEFEALKTDIAKGRLTPPRAARRISTPKALLPVGESY